MQKDKKVKKKREEEKKSLKGKKTFGQESLSDKSVK